MPRPCCASATTLLSTVGLSEPIVTSEAHRRTGSLLIRHLFLVVELAVSVKILASVLLASRLGYDVRVTIGRLDRLIALPRGRYLLERFLEVFARDY